MKHDPNYLRTFGLHDEQFPIIKEIRGKLHAGWAGNGWWKLGEIVRARKDGDRFTIRKLKLGKHPLPLTHILCNVPARALKKAKS